MLTTVGSPRSVWPTATFPERPISARNALARASWGSTIVDDSAGKSGFEDSAASWNATSAARHARKTALSVCVSLTWGVEDAVGTPGFSSCRATTSLPQAQTRTPHKIVPPAMRIAFRQDTAAQRSAGPPHASIPRCIRASWRAVRHLCSLWFSECLLLLSRGDGIHQTVTAPPCLRPIQEPCTHGHATSPGSSPPHCLARCLRPSPLPTNYATGLYLIRTHF